VNAARRNIFTVRKQRLFYFLFHSSNAAGFHSPSSRQIRKNSLHWRAKKERVVNHLMDVKIYYEDTDCGGVVYYANYLKYMERARTEFLATRGASVKQLMNEGTIFVVRRVEIEYKFPARYGDVIEIETWPADVSRATVTINHVMREKTSQRVLVEASAKLVYVGADTKPKRLSVEFVDRLK
jgi:acyl-CoA thioester hydrolase